LGQFLSASKCRHAINVDSSNLCEGAGVEIGHKTGTNHSQLEFSHRDFSFSDKLVYGGCGLRVKPIWLDMGSDRGVDTRFLVLVWIQARKYRNYTTGKRSVSRNGEWSISQWLFLTI
jgi:hypothetical protein